MMTRIREWIQRRWKSKWVVVGRDYLRRYGVITGMGIVAAYLLGRWLDAQAWTGFHGRKYGDAKTLWDWLDLLIVPIVLAIGAYLFNRRAALRDAAREEAIRERDKAWEEATRQEEILQSYLDDMSQLLMKEGLKAALKKRNKMAKSKQEDENKAGGESEEKPETEADEELPVVDVARARTVSTLRRLKDPQRRRELLDFLQDAGLYNGETALLRNAKMDGIDLEKTDLWEIDLSGASLIKAHLTGTNLLKAHLGGANLAGARLESANLESANLLGAHLWWTDLRGADLRGADLAGAFLVADLRGTDLAGARFSEETTLPDGSNWHEGVDWTQWTEPQEEAEGNKKE